MKKIAIIFLFLISVQSVTAIDRDQRRLERKKKRIERQYQHPNRHRKENGNGVKAMIIVALFVVVKLIPHD